jgi:hypothetical protein
VYFSSDDLERLQTAHSAVDGKCQRLVSSYITRNYKDSQAREFATQGFSRRLRTLVRCIDNTFEILPPDLVEPPNVDKLFDAMINIQAFVFNVFGCIDNLAWIWVREAGLPVTDKRLVGLFGGKTKEVRKSLSNELQEYLTGQKNWFDHLKDFRDALARRIPLYIPPYTIPTDKEAHHYELEVGKFDALKRRDREEYRRLEADRKALIPPPQKPLSAWLEASVASGQVRRKGLPARRLYSYQRAIADAISDPDIERVTLQKAARIGFSVLVAAAIGHYCGNDPSAILCLLPVESDCRDFMTSDLEPLFAASPALAGVLKAELVGQRGRRGRNTILSRQFPGGSLKIVAEKSPRNLRRHTSRILFVDEADGCETSAEGDPIDLATKRTLTFPDRNIILGSTPIDEETSRVCRAYAASDVPKRNMIES